METTNILHYEKVLIINSIFGLGNRLRAIASAYSICKSKHMKLIINWIPDCHCDCLIEDLVINIKDFAEIISLISSTLLFAAKSSFFVGISTP